MWRIQANCRTDHNVGFRNTSMSANSALGCLRPCPGPSRVCATVAAGPHTAALPVLMQAGAGLYDCRGTAGNTVACWAKRSGRDGGAPNHQQPSAVALTITRMIKEAETLQDLEDIVGEWSGSFDFIHTAAAFTKAGNIADRTRYYKLALGLSLARRLTAAWREQSEEASVQGLANVLWAAAKLSHADELLWTDTLAAFVKSINGANLLDVANVMWATMSAATGGKVPGVAPDVLAAYVDQIIEYTYVFVTNPTIENLQCQNLANILWALAKLRQNPGDIELDALLRSFARPSVLAQADSQSISNVLYAVSELFLHSEWRPASDEQIWSSILGEQQLNNLAVHGRAQHISNTVLALSRLGVVGANMVSAAPVLSLSLVQTSVVHILRGPVAQNVAGGSWTEQNISNTLYACAKLNVYEEDFMSKAARYAVTLLPSFNMLRLKVFAWSCGTLRIVNSQMYGCMIEQGDRLLTIADNHQRRSQKALGGEAAKMAAMCWSVAMVDLPQYAAMLKSLLAKCDIRQKRLSNSDAALLWKAHTWLIERRLLNGQGLSCVLTAEQLAAGEAFFLRRGVENNS